MANYFYVPDHSSLWILKNELIYFPHSVRINSLWVTLEKITLINEQ